MDYRDVKKHGKRVLLESGNKPGKYGGGPSFEKYDYPLDGEAEYIDAENPSAKTKKQLDTVGIDFTDETRGGSYLYVDNTPSYAKVRKKGLEVMPLKDSLKKYEWLKDYYWKGIPPTLDMYTAKAYSENVNGAFIRAKKGEKVQAPAQLCMLINKNQNLQIGHTIIIAEEDAEINVISACSTNGGVDDSFHIEIVEMFAAKNARINFTMIHNWDMKSVVRPRGMIHLAEGAHFTNNYVLLKPSHNVQLAPTTFMEGKNCSASYQNILASYKESNIDVGGAVQMPYDNCRADLFTKSLAFGGRSILRGNIVGRGTDQWGNINCKTLILNPEANVQAIPYIETNRREVEMIHEASVGKLDETKVEYLQTKGLTRPEAIQLLSSSFLMEASKNFPLNIKAQVAGWIEDIDAYAKN